jgi:hypothetical protein
MKLTELDPAWLERDGKRVGFVMRSPKDRSWWQIVVSEPMDRREQWELAKAANDGDSALQAAGPGVAWSIAGEFENLTVTPSVDGSRGGLWHGFITNGEIITV